MIPAFLQWVTAINLRLWVFLRQIFSSIQASSIPMPGKVVSAEVRSPPCRGCADPSNTNTSGEVVLGCGSYHAVQESFDELDLACGCSIHESAFGQEKCRVQTGHANSYGLYSISTSGALKNVSNDLSEAVGVHYDVSTASLDVGQANLTSEERAEFEWPERVLDESLIMDVLSSLQSGNDIESWDNDTTDGFLSFDTSDSTSECSKNDWAQGKDVGWNNTMLALRACMAGSESENILALRPEENQRLSRAHRITQQNQLRVIQEWRNDLGETKEKTPRPTVANAKYRLISNFQFPLSPTVSEETWGS